MAPRCGVCDEHESKYKCPVCALRYCSITCYKTHKPSHEPTEASPAADRSVSTSANTNAQRNAPTQVPPTLSIAAASATGSSPSTPSYASLASDPAFTTLLSRYPLLQAQLMTAYALTLDPGNPGHGSGSTRAAGDTPISGRGRGWNSRFSRARGRGRGGRGGRGGSIGDGHGNRGRGWTAERGRKEALAFLQRSSGGMKGQEEEVWREDDESEGLREFVRLCALRFGREAA